MVEDIKIEYDQTAKGDNGRSKDTDTFNGKSPHPRKIKNRYYEDAEITAATGYAGIIARKATSKAMRKRKKKRKSQFQTVLSDSDNNPQQSTTGINFWFIDPTDRNCFPPRSHKHHPHRRWDFF